MHGVPHEEAYGHVAFRLWKSFCRDEGACGRARRWLEEGSALLNAPDLLSESFNPGRPSLRPGQDERHDGFSWRRGTPWGKP